MTLVVYIHGVLVPLLKLEYLYFPNLPWCLDLVRLWIGLNLSTISATPEGIPVPEGFPFKCIPKNNCYKCCDNRSCEIFVPFKYVYGNFSLSNLCNSFVFISTFAKVHVITRNSIRNTTAWEEGYPFVEDDPSTYNVTHTLCNKFCKKPPCPPFPPKPTPPPTPKQIGRAHV